MMSLYFNFKKVGEVGVIFINILKASLIKIHPGFQRIVFLVSVNMLLV